MLIVTCEKGMDKERVYMNLIKGWSIELTPKQLELIEVALRMRVYDLERGVEEILRYKPSKMQMEVIKENRMEQKMCNELLHHLFVDKEGIYK